MPTCESPLTIDTTPAPQRGWTPALKARFLDRLAAHGNARAACRAVNLSHEAAYRLRRRDEDFARGWKAAVLLARENGVQVLAEHAIEGFEEEVWYRGKHVGNRRRFDTRLLLAHLARLDKLADDESADADAARFDELVARIAGEEAPATQHDDRLLPLARDEFAEQASVVADDAVTEAWTEATGKPTTSAALGPENYDIYAAECDAAAEQGRADGEAEWDAWFARACAMVDAHAGYAGVRPSTGSGRAEFGNDRSAPLTPSAPLTLSLSKGRFETPDLLALSLSKGPESVPLSFPRTLSHASTSALALSLAKGVRKWPGIDLAPRGPRSSRGSLHRSAIDFSRAAA